MTAESKIPEDTSTLTADEQIMADFLSRHAEPPMEEETEPSKTMQKAEKPQKAQEDLTQAANESGGEEDLLDPDTLEALGLIPERQPASGDDENGTGGQQTVDLAPIAAAMKVDQTDLTVQEGEIMVRTKVDGEEATVPLAKLREGYQLRQHFTRQQQQFLEERKKWEETREQQEQQFQQQASLAQQVLEAEETALNRDYTRDWPALRKEDPAEYAAQVAEYNQRLQQIRSKKQALTEAVQQRQQEQTQQMQQYLAAERQKFVAKSGWKEEELETNAQRLRGYLVSQAEIPEQMVDQLTDHRVFLLAEKARKYDELMRRVDLSRKRVKEAPRPTPTGTAAGQEGKSRTKLKDAMRKLRKTGRPEDAVDVFAQMDFN